MKEQDDQESAAPESERDGGPPDRRSPAFLNEIISQLPELSVARWEPAQTLNVHQDLGGMVTLDVDAFLQPLESIAEKRHE